MKKLFENWNKYKNQSEELEEGVENITPENIQLALQALEQIGINFAPVVAGLGAFEAARLLKQKLTGEAPEEAPEPAPPMQESRADVLNESIGVETEELLRTAVEKAYKDMVASHHPEQIDADTGEPVDRDPAAVARAQIVGLVASYLEKMSEPEEHLAGAEGL